MRTLALLMFVSFAVLNTTHGNDGETKQQVTGNIETQLISNRQHDLAQAATPQTNCTTSAPSILWQLTERIVQAFTAAVNDPSLIQSRIENASAAYGLSPSQRRLTASIVAGVPLTDAVKHEGIRISTGRTQLQRIFAKVGVRTQPALVRAMLAVSGPG